MRVARNLAFGIGASVWSAGVGIIAIPFFIRYLGIESYGLIGFYVTLQAVLQLLDLGIAPAVNRQIATQTALGNVSVAANVVRTFAVVYWCIAAVIGLGVWLLADVIASHWLHSSQLPQPQLARTIAIMGALVACRWPIALYQAAIIGSERLWLSAVINAVALTVGNLGAIVLLALVSPTIEAFFLWQMGTSIAQVLILQRASWRPLTAGTDPAFDVQVLKESWRFSSGMVGVSLATILLMQADKLMLSKMLALGDFGRYALAGVVAGAVYILLTPVFNSVFPRMASLVAVGDEAGLLHLYRHGTRLLACVLLPLAMTMAAFSSDIVSVWTGDVGLGASVGPIAALLLLGSACNGIMHFPYALQLAHGDSRLPLIICLLMVALLVPTLVILTLRYGAVGSASAWLVVNVFYVVIGTWLTHRRFLRGFGRQWLRFDVGPPLTVTTLTVAAGWWMLATESVVTIRLLGAIAIGVASIAINLSLLPGFHRQQIKASMLALVRGST